MSQTRCVERGLDQFNQLQSGIKQAQREAANHVESYASLSVDVQSCSRRARRALKAIQEAIEESSADACRRVKKGPVPSMQTDTPLGLPHPPPPTVLTGEGNGTHMHRSSTLPPPPHTATLPPLSQYTPATQYTETLRSQPLSTASHPLQPTSSSPVKSTPASMPLAVSASPPPQPPTLHQPPSPSPSSPSIDLSDNSENHKPPSPLPSAVSASQHSAGPRHTPSAATSLAHSLQSLVPSFTQHAKPPSHPQQPTSTPQQPPSHPQQQQPPSPHQP
eukprot:Sspe_Gene.78230::Locus_48926_Transcript_1_1_Confidence_1.000_Length_870::g.78230::m.78230